MSQSTGGLNTAAAADSATCNTAPVAVQARRHSHCRRKSRLAKAGNAALACARPSRPEEQPIDKVQHPLQSSGPGHKNGVITAAVLKTTRICLPKVLNARWIVMAAAPFTSTAFCCCQTDSSPMCWRISGCRAHSVLRLQVVDDAVDVGAVRHLHMQKQSLSVSCMKQVGQ